MTVPIDQAIRRSASQAERGQNGRALPATAPHAWQGKQAGLKAGFYRALATFSSRSSMKSTDEGATSSSLKTDLEIFYVRLRDTDLTRVELALEQIPVAEHLGHMVCTVRLLICREVAANAANPQCPARFSTMPMSTRMALRICRTSSERSARFHLCKTTLNSFEKPSPRVR